MMQKGLSRLTAVSLILIAAIMRGIARCNEALTDLRKASWAASTMPRVSGPRLSFCMATIDPNSAWAML